MRGEAGGAEGGSSNILAHVMRRFRSYTRPCFSGFALGSCPRCSHRPVRSSSTQCIGSM